MRVKNKRLSQRDRDVLLAFAKKQIEATEDRTALNSAYDVAARLVCEAVEKDNPPSEMKVLAKYDLAHEYTCIDVSTGGMDYDQFNFRSGDKRAPLLPYSRRGCGYGRRSPILLEGEAAQQFSAYQEARKAREATVKARIADFKALIWGTPSFNALVETWPAAEALRESIVGTGTALAVLSSEVVERIKSDPALLAEAA